MDEVRPSLFSQSHLSVSLFSFSHFCNICLDPMEIIIIKEGEGERQIDDEAEEKAINASQKKGGSLENVGGGDERKGFLIVVLLFNADSWVF